MEPDSYWYLERLGHFFAYKYAKNLAKDKAVLEIGFGTGYGANYLTHFTASVIAIDISATLARSSHKKYCKRNLNLTVASGLHIPLKDTSMDAVFSFQVIEHIKPHRVHTLLKEVKRVLKPDGIFVATTPNRKIRLLPFQKPWNPEHMTEYDATGFNHIFHTAFDDVTTLGLHGTKVVDATIRNRGKQKPIIAYLLQPLKTTLKKTMPDTILKQMKTVKNLITPHRKKYPTPTTDAWLSDYKVTPNNLNTSLSLYGICKK